MKRRSPIASILLPALVLWLAGIAVAVAGGGSKRLAADFRMERTLSALADKIASAGKLYLGGTGLLRWEMTSPSRSVLVVNQGKAWIHYPDLHVTKGFDLSTDPVMRVMSEHLLVLTSGEFDRVGELYAVSDLAGGAKRLLPREEAVQNVFQELHVKIGESGVIAWVELIAAGGDLTRIEFHNVNVDPALDPALFEKPGG